MSRQSRIGLNVTKNIPGALGKNSSFSEILPGAANLNLETTPVLSPETSPQYSVAPPELSDHSLAITRLQAPKRARELLQLIKSVRDDPLGVQAEDGVIREVVTEFEYDQLLELALNESLPFYDDDSFRYEYSHKRSEFVVFLPTTILDYADGDVARTTLMPTIVHERLAEAVDNIVKPWYLNLASAGGLPGAVAGNIQAEGTADIELSAYSGQHRSKSIVQADKRYRYEVSASDDSEDTDSDANETEVKEASNELPDLIVQVAFSNPKTSKELADKARECIIKSRGRICTVVTIDLTACYPSGKAGQGKDCKFSILRAKRTGRKMAIDETSSVYNQIFSESSDHLPGVGNHQDITLSLLDFVSNDHLQSLPDFNGKRIEASDLGDIQVSISARYLYTQFKRVSKEWRKAKQKKNATTSASGAAAAPYASSSITRAGRDTRRKGKDDRPIKRAKRGYANIAGED
ncbi:hypothetical protein F4778DRAFT_728778 [Xylariomycetidae sp. FL2044]|nr:hypothetical protein F4778DRAFT_728778 [Xylariomycetidae sp. FL2044]